MVIVYAIIMSSWKQYGGMNNFERSGQIDAYSITVNKLNLKESYQGIFDICGQLIVKGDAIIDGTLFVKEGMDISGNVVIGEPGSLLTVNSDSIFNGSLQLNSAFNALGNIQSGQNIIADRDVMVGRAIDFSGGSFLYSSGNALGLNTMTPMAAFDISTNFVNGIIVSSSNNKNENILAQNRLHKGISLGVDLSSTYMYFNFDTPIPGPADGGIYYRPGGYLNIDVSKNVNISCPLTVSVGDNPTHIRGEVFTVYDISQGVYFGNIYQNGAAYTGVAAAFLADSSNSNVSTFMGTPGGVGLSIGGGAYPLDVKKGMSSIGLTDTSGVYTPAQVIVSGDSTSHSLTTTGINTYQPRINSYVLDVNGPIHVDNGDIASIDTNPSFELYSISVAPNNRNTVVALGSSIEVLNDIPSGRVPFLPNEKLIVSYNGGLSWGYVDVSNSAGIFSGNSVLKGITLNNIHLYDSNNWFITGETNMIANSYDAGISWQNISTSGLANNSNFKNVYINPTSNLSGNVFGLFSVDVSFVLFEIPINGPFTTSVNQKIITSGLSSISAIRANSQTIYISGNAIAKFNASNSVINQTPVLQWKHSYGTSYSYNDIQIFDNSYVIAVGGNIISTTINGGLSWQDISFNLLYGGQGVNFTGVHMADISNAIAVGSQGNVWITNNKGTSWSVIPLNLINPSGESQMLLNTSNRLRNVVMTDNNTILITNTLQSYNYYTNTYGKSNLFTVYSPNFINRMNNMVLDISGGVRISGDMYINDGGLFGSNNTNFSLLNSGVKTLSLGGDTTSIIMGSIVGNTEIRNNVVMSAVSTSTSSTTGALRVAGGVGIGGNVNVAGRMNVVSDVSFNRNIIVGGIMNVVSDASFNANVIITGNKNSSNINTGALIVKGGVGITGNLYLGGTFGFSNDLDLSGNLRVNAITLTSGNLFTTSNIMNISSQIGLPGGTNIRIGRNFDTVEINGNVEFSNNITFENTTPSNNTTTGVLVVAGGVGIGGNLNIGGFSNFMSDSSFDEKVLIKNTTTSTNPTTGALIVSGGIGVSDAVNIGTNLKVGDSSVFIGVSNFVSDVSLNGIVLITSNISSNNINSGSLVVRGGIGVSGNSNIGGYMNVLLDSSMNGNVLMTSRTSSTSSRTGALVVSGGAGIGGNINVLGFSNFISDASFNGNVLITSNKVSTGTTSGALVVSGGVGIGGNLNVNGMNSIFNNNVNVIGNITAGRLVPLNNTFDFSNPNQQTAYSIAHVGDNVTIYGTVSIPNLITASTPQASSASPTIIVNLKSVLGNATSIGAGIDIFDNSYVNIPEMAVYPYNIVAYMHVGQDLQSFVFKAPSWGIINKLNPLSNLYSISPPNKVRLAINEMTFGNVLSPSKIVNRGLVILQPDTAYQAYQSGRNNSYFTPYSDADYAINICPDFDISNILLKEFDTVVGTQTISTNMIIGNTLVPKNLNVFGNIISNRNIGVGTDDPLVSLDVSGSARFIGPFISTNYDTLRFSTNYGQSLKNNLNQATSGNYYQDCATSYDGQFQYGLLYHKTGVGSVNVSNTYGATWSQTALPTNYSGNIIYQAVPYMNGNVVSFPFNSLAANITLANAIPLNIQIGRYVASGSSFGSGSDYYNVFGNLTETSWNPFGNDYNNLGNYTGQYLTLNSGNGLSIGGEYIQISLPYSFIIKHYRIYDNLNLQRYPKSTYLFGSNNGSSWFSLVPGGSNINANITTTVNIINNTPYNYYRFVINSINNTSGTNSPLLTRIDLSGIFQNVTGSFSSAMATSGTGQNITVANQGYYAGQGNLITSSDYGATFIDSRVRDTGAVWQAVALNQTGNVQVAVSQNRSGFGNIFMSYNYGNTWSNVSSQIILNGWQTVSISSSGQYITAIAATFATNVRGNILISSNYGSSFTQPSANPTIYNYIEHVAGFLNLGITDFNKTVCVSSSGQYQTALGLALSSQTNGTANIWISSNYGVIWRDTGAKAPVNGHVSVFTSITMNGSGQNQIATYMTGNIITGVASTVSGNALVSSDYGNSWSTSLKYSIPSVTSSGNTYYGGVTKVQSSLNGQYVFGISKYQDISASTYTNTTNTAFGVGNVYLSSVPVTSGLFSTQYFGSAHTGNVFQSHGLELSVPNANNSALVAGYDVNWNAGYINVADQSGFSSLGLNTTGGFIGIGKIAPLATLDISGNAIISGGLTIGGATNFASNVSFNTMSITSTTNSTGPTSGALILSGGAGIGGNIFLGGNLITGGDLSCNGNISVGPRTASISTTSGALRVAGGAGILGNLFLGSNLITGGDLSCNGNIIVGPRTASISTTTGALRVAGGAGIVGNINVGGFSNFAFDSTFNGNIQMTQSNNPLWFVTNNASSFNGTLASGTDVGIFYGTTNPAAAGLVISPRGAGGGIKLATDGKVGIGISTPTVALDVIGAIKSTGSISAATATDTINGVIINNSAVSNITTIGLSGAITGATATNTINGVIINNRAVSNITTIGLSGAITGATATDTINGVIINNSAVSNITTIGLSGAITGATATNTINGVIINNRAVSNITTIGLSGAITGATATNTINGVIINNSAVSNITTLSASGQITGASFNATSDYRMKQNAQPLLITRSIDLLKPVEYDLSGGSHDMGFLAHEVQEVLPFLVSGEKDGPGMQSMNYNGFIALLVKELQDLKKENRELKGRMNRLEKYYM